MRTAKTPERTNNRKKRVTLLGVIANGSTSDARKLLMKYDEPDAKNHDDLEYRLTKLYQKAPDKIQFEKELSAIHPHKDFIMKYNTPELTEIPKEVIDITKQMATTPENYSTSNFSDTKSCACGCGKSNLTGSTNDPIQSQNASGLNAGMMMMGMLGIITIFALTIRNK
jgi:hypothetical protein